MRDFTDEDLAKLAIEHGHGCSLRFDDDIMDVEEDMLWFDGNLIPLMRELLRLAAQE